MTIEISEQGRQLRIMVGGEVEILVPPVTAKAGASILVTYIEATNIGAGALFGNLEERATDLAHLSLGKPIYVDPENPTARELEAQAKFEDLWERINELRSGEVQAIVEAAMFWNSMGGSFATAKIAADGDRPKAIALLLQETGLSLSPIGTQKVGGEANSTPSPSVTSGTSSPSGIATKSSQPVERTPLGLPIPPTE